MKVYRGETINHGTGILMVSGYSDQGFQIVCDDSEITLDVEGAKALRDHIDEFLLSGVSA